MKRVGVAGLLMGCLIAMAASAPASDEPRTRLDDLLREALQRNPEILAAQKRYEAARQRPSQAGSLPEPMFSPGWNSSTWPWPGAGLGSEPTANIGFMVSQEIPYPGKRKLASDMAVREAEAEFQQYEQTRLSVVSRIKQAYYRLAFTYAAAEVLDRNRELLEQLLRIAEIRYSAGKAEQQDVLKTQTQITLLETKRVQLEQERRSRAAEINSLVNLAPGTFNARPADLPRAPVLPPLSELEASARDNSPMLRRDLKMVQRSELAVNMARKDFYPDVTLNGGYYNMGSMRDMYMFRADIKIPLYFFRKQRPALAEQAMNLVQSRHNYEASSQSIDFRIREDYAMAETASRLAELYSKGVIPQAGLTIESSLASYETGKVDSMTVLMNCMGIIEYEMNYYEELRDLHLALSRLEEMTGRGIIPAEEK